MIFINRDQTMWKGNESNTRSAQKNFRLATVKMVAGGVDGVAGNALGPPSGSRKTLVAKTDVKFQTFQKFQINSIYLSRT